MPPMQRRSFLAASLASGAALASPARLFAQVGPDLRTRRLLAVAQEQVARAGSALWRRDLVGIADFGLHSAMPRFHFVNLEAGSVDSMLVTHGSGSDPEHDGWLNGYSNLENSWATSRGAYITWEWYEGRFGTSVRLGGLDPDNSNAFPRAIVMHQAAYATPEHVARWGRLGRSNGCFAFGPEVFPTAMLRMAGGRLLFAGNLGIGPAGEDVVPPPQAAVDFAAFARANSGAQADPDPNAVQLPPTDAPGGID